MKKLHLDPYVINRLMNFLQDSEQRVTVDGITTKFLRIPWRAPRECSWSNSIFIMMVNGIKPIDSKNELC